MIKRFTACLLLIAFVGIKGWSINTVTISSSSGHPGDEVVVVASLANSDAVSAVQVDIPLNENLAFVDGSVQLNDSRSNGHSISAVRTKEGLRVIVYSLTLTNLRQNEGQLFSFKLKLKPEPATYVLMPEVLLTGQNNERLNVEVNSGSVTILSPKMLIRTSEIDFGSLPVRETYKENIVIENIGNEPMNVTGISITGSIFSLDKENITVDAGATANIGISFSPSWKGIFEETATITSNAVNSKEITSIEVKASAYTINEIHVADVSGKADSEVSVSICMNNMEAISAAQFSFMLPEELTYVDSSVKSSHATHSAYSSFKDGKLTLMLLSPNKELIPEGNGELLTFKLTLAGTCGVYALNPIDVVLGNQQLENVVSMSESGSVSIGSPIVSCVSEFNLPLTPVGYMATDKFVIQNQGSEPLVISRISFLDESFSVSESLPISISPSECTSFHINRIMDEAGSFATEMNIYCNDPVERVKTVRVTGHSCEANNLSAFVETTEDGFVMHAMMDNQSDIVAVQAELVLPEGMTCSQSDMELDSRLDGFMYSVIDKGGKYVVFVYSLNQKIILSGRGRLFDIRLHGKTSGNIEWRDVLLSNTAGDNVASATSFVIDLSVTPGDVNNDGAADVADVLFLSHILRGDRDDAYHRADVNGDGKVNRADLSALRNILVR